MEEELFQRIDMLMRSQGKKKKDLNDYLGLNHSTYDSWKTGKSKSYMRYIDKISEYLNVTPTYLTNGIDILVSYENIDKKKEEELLWLFRNTSSEMQDCIISTLKIYNRK